MYIYLKFLKLVLPSGIGNTHKIAIFRMGYGENGTVTFFETLADDVFRHNYSMMQIKTKMNNGKISRLPRPTPLIPKYLVDSTLIGRLKIRTLK